MQLRERFHRCFATTHAWRREARPARPWHFVALAALLGLAPRPAHAFTIETPITEACHEKITLEAWKNAQQQYPELTGPLPSRGDDEALMDDLQFSVPDSLREIGAVTLLLGVRDNDVKSHGPLDLEVLGRATSSAGVQDEHCLREAEHDEPDGSRAALGACRDYIRTTLLDALDGLDGAGVPDGTNRETLTVSLAIRDRVEVPVPRFFLRAGRGLHALQDSFTHTFRRPDELGKVTAVVNFQEFSEKTLDERVDGPAHAAELDRCDDPDELRAERRRMAIEASTMALLILLDRASERDVKAADIEAMLDGYVAFDQGSDCNADNDWCQAPERAYGTSTCACRAAGAPTPAGTAALLLLALLGVARYARARRGRSRGHRAAAWAALACSLALARPAGAQEEEPQGIIDSPARALAGKSKAGMPNRVDRGGAIFARVATGASYDNAAFSGGAGLRYQLSRLFMLGFDAEWNPYIAITSSTLRSGSINGYFSLIRRFQLQTESLNVRSTVSLGASMLMFDLVGAEKYSIGPFVGISFLGGEWKAARGFYLTIDPTYIAIPIPHLTGVPFMYAQYRFQVGLEFGG